jgi:hypothetical protein
MELINRWFYRCRVCLAVFAVNDVRLFDIPCPYCDADKVELMGQVRQDKLVLEGERTACDERCTHARGPICVCHCGGPNHGTGLVVHFVKVVGEAGKVIWQAQVDATLKAQFQAQAAEFNALAVKAEEAFASHYAAEIETLKAGRRVRDYARWRAHFDDNKRLQKVRNFKVHSKRMKELAALIARWEIGTLAAQPEVRQSSGPTAIQVLEASEVKAMFDAQDASAAMRSEVPNKALSFLAGEPVNNQGKPLESEVAVTEPGVYERAGQVYVVQFNRQKTRLYAKRLVESAPRLTETGTHVDFDFEYAKGAIYSLRPEDLMPLERAKELIVRYGRCIRCGARLQAATSVERGIGPVCIRYFKQP